MPGHPIRLVLFDIGGVLVELSGLAVLLAWMKNRITVEQAYTFWLTSPAVRAFESGRMQPEPFADQLIAELRLPISRAEFMREMSTWGRQLLPGAVELVSRVPKHYLRATLCNTNVVHWSLVQQHRELMAAFDHHFASHLTGKIKPDAEAFQHVLDSLGCGAEETLFVDDSRLNIEAAKRLGIRAFQVKGPAEAEQVLRETGVIHGERTSTTETQRQ